MPLNIRDRAGSHPLKFLLSVLITLQAAGASAQSEGAVVGSVGAKADLRPLQVQANEWLLARLAGAPTQREQQPTRMQGNPRTLFGDVVHDFGTVFTSPDNLRLVGLGLAASSAAVLLDDEVATSSFGTGPVEGGFFDRFFEPAELLGSWQVQIGGPAAIYIAGRLGGKSALVGLSGDLIRAQIVSQGLTQAIKRAARRTRPDGSSATSFPSGHTSATFAAAAVFHRHYGWKAGAPAFVFSTWVATSRLNEQKHWLSDLPFAVAVGLMAGRTVTRDLQGVTIAPMMRPGGGGVQLSYGAPH